MANRDYYGSSPPREHLNAPLPPVPTSSTSHTNKPLPSPFTPLTPVSPFDDEEAHNPRPHYQNSSPYRTESHQGYNRNPFGDDAAIPMHQTHYPKHDEPASYPFPSQQPIYEQSPHSDRRHKHRRKKEPFLSWHTPWFIYIITLVQIIVFVAEVVKNAVLTGSPIEIHPAFNPMIGPSPYVLINMGARYVPCMRNQNGVQNSNETLYWPCPNQTDNNPTCTLSDLCGFSGVPAPVQFGSLDADPAPNQWFRFIVPIFLHAGIIHIGFNMLLQVLLGGDMERVIGPLRLALVYFSSGIFGFVLGGNFAASGIASCGASGSIFGIIALTLLDLLYTWPQRPKPIRDLIFIILDIAISFVLGLLPGLDNFSHIGGFLMGLVLGVCLLRSPTTLRVRTGSVTDDKNPFPPPAYAMASGGLSAGDGTSPLVHGAHQRGNAHVEDSSYGFLTKPSSTALFSSPKKVFSNRKPLWWAWWLLRAGALVGVIAAFIVLIQSFYTHHDTQCPNCKYLSCLPISNWCEIGDLTFNTQNTTSSKV